MSSITTKNYGDIINDEKKSEKMNEKFGLKFKPKIFLFFQSPITGRKKSYNHGLAIRQDFQLAVKEKSGFFFSFI